MAAETSEPIRDALVSEPGIAGLLADWRDSVAVFTKVPVPAGASSPLIVLDAEITGDNDALVSRRPVIQRDIKVYGEKDTDTRAVETLARLVRDLFHRNRFALTIAGHHVIQIRANGPRPAPTDDDTRIGRLVTLSIELEEI